VLGLGYNDQRFDAFALRLPSGGAGGSSIFNEERLTFWRQLVAIAAGGGFSFIISC